MKKARVDTSKFLGTQLPDGYVVSEYLGKGKIGVVFRAYNQSLGHELACKFIQTSLLRTGWERELEKLSQLTGVPGIVQYIRHGTAPIGDTEFTFVLLQFIKGKNLREFLSDRSTQIDMAFVCAITERLLHVLHACAAVGISHGDLHQGNIMISDPDIRLPGSPQVVYVNDFGYGGSHNGLQPKDDFRQFAAILADLLLRLDRADLDPLDKVLHEKLENFVRKCVLELDATQGASSRHTALLIEEFDSTKISARRQAAAASAGDEIKEPGDYLWAEALGNRQDEWRNLFVPEFLGVQDLLTKNISILTGARGCGKTMAFRRLTVFMDALVGEASGVRGSDEFLGFYLNCRDLAEAFPYLPNRLHTGDQLRITHFFHLAWLSEILKAIALRDEPKAQSNRWLDTLFSSLFGNSYPKLGLDGDTLAHCAAFVEDEKERCRLGRRGRRTGMDVWPLARHDLLDRIQSALHDHVSWINGKPFYMFLDDYTIPIVPRVVQRILNPIVFKRRDRLFFKVSTEASNSFDRSGVAGKPLELHHDFELIDLATESLHQDDRTKTGLLDRIFRPRIDRHSQLGGQNLGLRDVLGTSGQSNNQLAHRIREGRQKILYAGESSFVGLWASDIRIMIRMMSEMFREVNGQLSAESHEIPPAIQDKCYRTQGGEFLKFAESVSDPSLWESGPSSTKPGDPYGKHLRDIAEAFAQVAHYDLTDGPLVSNEGSQNPKQAFRIEVMDHLDLPREALRYYDGLVRWHIFMQDWRGKSVRGMITPRLYLNRVLIPTAQLTFSRHDSVSLTNAQFTELLLSPREFPAKYKKHRELSRKRKEKSLKFEL